MKFKSIAVFCASSSGFDAIWTQKAYSVGVFMAQHNITVVYGGGRVGLMGAVADGALDHKGEVIGVIPHFLNSKEIGHHGVTTLITVDNMHQRKMKMNELSEAIIALPGGYGTMEELFEMITWGQLGLHQKPVGLLNINGFYDSVIRIIKTYLDFARDIKKWGFKIGLRGEYTISNGYSPTLDEAVKKNYFDLFPSASVSYSLNENHNFSLSYSRKVTRPNYNDLNPFETYIDKRTYVKGNSFLRPSYKDGFTLVYTLFKRFNVAVGFDYTNDAIVESMGQDSVLKTTWVLKENVGRQSTGYVNLTVPLRIGKVWTMYNNLTGIHLYFKGPVSGYYVDQGTFFVQGNSTNTFKLNSQLSAEVLVRGNTRFIFNMYEIQPRIATDLGLTYNFKDKVSSLKFGFTDVFHTDHNNVFTHFKEFDSKIYQYHDSQTFRLTFTRKFGNLKQSFRRIDNNSEEKERAM